jgi:hypothetical protein
MSVSSRNLQKLLSRPPPPAPFRARKPFEPRPTYYPNLLPPVPWIVRGDNALLLLVAIGVSGAAALMFF